MREAEDGAVWGDRLDHCLEIIREAIPIEVDVGQGAVAVTAEIGRPSVKTRQSSSQRGIDATVKTGAVGHEQRRTFAAEIMKGQ